MDLKKEAKEVIQTLHKKLFAICRDAQDYWESGGPGSHGKMDCSCGCKWYLELAGIVGQDWGVCFCPKSPRAGLLTFEHMGCDEFKRKIPWPEPASHGKDKRKKG